MFACVAMPMCNHFLMVLSVQRELTEEEKRTVENSDAYLSFLGRTSRFMERALVHKFDLFTEYNLQQDEERYVSVHTLPHLFVCNYNRLLHCAVRLTKVQSSH